jgi:thioredoxin reductase (NADPH)
VFDYEVVIVGGGPAGLTAGLHLARAGYRTLILERDLFGGNLQHTGQIRDYPGFPAGITGAQLAAQMVEQAQLSGARLEQAEVNGVEVFLRSRWVACEDGRGFSGGVVILAGGSRFKKLGIQNEERLRGRGVIDCTPCDAGFFVGHPVVVYGSNDHALDDAVYLAEKGAQVTVLVPGDQLDAAAPLQSRTRELDGIHLRYGVSIEGIVGSDRVEAVVCVDGGSNQQTRVPARGLAIRIGSEPNTSAFADMLDLDPHDRILVNPDLETSARYVLACGDIRSGARPSVATAVGDGAAAASRAAELLTELANPEKK